MPGYCLSQLITQTESRRIDNSARSERLVATDHQAGKKELAS
jgi:hypothetical protein